MIENITSADILIISKKGEYKKGVIPPFKTHHPGAVFLFYLAIAGKALLELFILQPIRQNIYISLAANDIIIIYLCQNITEL